jgi:predicted phosphoribosyltransferase
VIDDGLATGATMVAALRWARTSGAARVVAAVPVGPAQSVALIRREADAVVCLKTPKFFFAVGPHYALFGQVDDTEVVRLLAENRLERGADAALAVAPRGKP